MPAGVQRAVRFPAGLANRSTSARSRRATPPTSAWELIRLAGPT